MVRMSFRRAPQLLLVLSLVLGSSLQAFAQDAPARRGRKYKAPPATSHIEVQVLKKHNGKPIMNAAVVFNPSMDGKDEGNLEVKTDPDGKAIIDVIPTGSTVRVQIIATGYATYAEDYVIDQPTKEITISMIRPQAQVSAYENNEGKASTRKAGVQEPVRPNPVTPPASSATPAQPAPAATPKQ
jgi:hypothetical protein